MNRFPKTHRTGLLLASTFAATLSLSGLASADLPPCPGDFDYSGGVDFADILFVMAEWGACPEGTPAPEFSGREIGGFGDLRYVQTADLDGDGDIDVLSGSPTNAFWYERDGNGFTFHDFEEPPGILMGLEIADLDDDGDPDIVTCGTIGVTWFSNDGAGSFTQHPVAGGYTIEAEVGDVNGDGTRDIVASRQGVTHLYVNLSNGLGAPALIDAGEIAEYEALDFAIGDIDGDGDGDILLNATAGQEDDPLVWLESDGNAFPTFIPHEIDSLPTFRSCALGDVDGDGDLDVLAGSRYEAAWYENDGEAGFTKRLLASSDQNIYVRSIKLADLDDDGDQDIAMSPGFAGDVSWFENDGGSTTPAFTEHAAASDFGWASAVSPADMDGDGDLDLVTSYGLGDGDVVWHENHQIEPCPADGNQDGEVGMMELMYLITAWGPCPSGP